MGLHEYRIVNQISVKIIALAVTAASIFSLSTNMADAEIVCVFCHKLYSNDHDHVPKELPCEGEHLAGLSCLKEARRGGSVKCPICTVNNSTTTSPEQLPTNKAILRMALKQSTRSTTVTQSSVAG